MSWTRRLLLAMTTVCFVTLMGCYTLVTVPQRTVYRMETDDYVIEEEGYEDMGAGMTAESTLWLIDKGIKIMGIDSWTWDQPFDVMRERNDPDRFLEAHFIGNEKEYCHLESLANLDKIPRPFDFKVAVFPVKIEGASAGWTRAVAILED